MILQNTMLFFACASIIANYPHTYWAIDHISNVPLRLHGAGLLRRHDVLESLRARVVHLGTQRTRVRGV